MTLRRSDTSEEVYGPALIDAEGQAIVAVDHLHEHREAIVKVIAAVLPLLLRQRPAGVHPDNVDWFGQAVLRAVEAIEHAAIMAGWTEAEINAELEDAVETMCFRFREEDAK